jgi:hypothetical protein
MTVHQQVDEKGMWGDGGGEVALAFSRASHLTSPLCCIFSRFGMPYHKVES